MFIQNSIICNFHRRKRIAHRFTLIELLVVVAIIGILVSILLPRLNKARKVAIEAVCLSNQSQLARGCLVYSNNNSSKLPISLGSWSGNWDVQLHGVNRNLGLIDEFVTASGDLFHCPLLDTSMMDRPYHNMNVESHSWGGGMKRYNKGNGRIIIGYSLRTIGWFRVNNSNAMKTTDDSSSILIHDVFDPRVGIKFHHKDNYNVIRMDGSGVKFKDKRLVLNSRSPGRFDGGGNPGMEQAVYQWLEEQIN
jgi:prepilin-type N-terminal cleavage/methylation domain-containing protein